MRNIKIPVDLQSALRADQILKETIAEIESELAKRKKPSYRQELQKERLQGALKASELNSADIHNFGYLLDPKAFEQKAVELKKQLIDCSKDELAISLARTKLEQKITCGYFDILSRSLDQFEHIADGDEYRKTKSNDSRQEGRNNNFTEDEQYLLKTLNELKKRRKSRPLEWDDYQIFKHDVHLFKPNPSYQQQVRVVGDAKQLTGDNLAIHKEITKDENSGWSDSRLRKFFTKHTGLTPKSK